MSRDIKALILDVDGTLVSGKKTILSNKIKNWINNSKKYFYTCLFSNNPSRNRIKLVSEQLDLKYTYAGGKPSKKKLIKVLDEIPFSYNEIAIIGDRVFTDILVGNRLGIYTILVDSVDSCGERLEKNNFQSLERFFAKIITGELL